MIAKKLPMYNIDNFFQFSLAQAGTEERKRLVKL